MREIMRESNGLMTNELMFAKVHPNAIIPSKERENAGYDVYACFDEDYMIIPAHATKLIPTGIASAMCDRYYLNVAERSSTGKIGMKYSGGIIDSSFRGEIQILISNVNDKPIIISKLNGEELLDVLCKENLEETGFDCIIYPYQKAIAQLIVHEVHQMDVKEISYEDLLKIPSKRGTGMLGSSNK